MFQWAKQNIAGIIFFYVPDQESFKKMPKLINWNKDIRTIQQFLAQDLIITSFHYLNQNW